MSDYAETFDSIMADLFPGETFKTEWNVLVGAYGGYVTIRKKGSRSVDITKEQALAGRAIALTLQTAQDGERGIG